MRLLVTGTHGQVVTALKARASTHLNVTALGRPELDLATAKDLAELLRSFSPDVIVNAAAFTAVDKAESEAEQAFAVNSGGAKAVARAASKLNVPMIQISTDYVFDGTASQPLSENDAVNPIGVYGASKLAGELAVAAETENFVILRTAWVYAPFGASFVRTMLRLAATRDEVRVVADQFGTPTSALDIASAIETIAESLLRHPQNSELVGIFNLTAQGGPISWADFATEIFTQSDALGGPSARVIPISTAEYPTPAKRPAYSCLNGEKLSRLHGTQLPQWKVGLSEVLTQIKKGHWL